MERIEKEFAYRLIKNEKETNYILYFYTNKFTEIWINTNYSYYCNNEDFAYTREQFLKYVKYLLELKNVVVILERLNKEYSLC